MKKPKRNRLMERADRFLNHCLGIHSQKLDHLTETDKQLNQHIGYLESDIASNPRDTFCILDVSGSMVTCDCRVSRLEASKKANEEFIKHRMHISPQDRIAVVPFSDHAKVLLPLTDIRLSKKIIKSIRSLQTGGGTDITTGLRVARDLFIKNASKKSQMNRNKHILMLTDGCSGGNPVPLANKLTKKINIHENKVAIVKVRFDEGYIKVSYAQE